MRGICVPWIADGPIAAPVVVDVVDVLDVDGAITGLEDRLTLPDSLELGSARSR